MLLRLVVETPTGEGFTEMYPPYSVVVMGISQGAGHAHHLVIALCQEFHPARRLGQDRLSAFALPCKLINQFAFCFGIGA